MAARRVNAVGLLAAVAGGVLVAAVGVFFLVVGVKDANQWAGVFGFFIGVAGLVVSGYSAVLTRRSLARATPAADAGVGRQRVDAARDAFTAQLPAKQPAPVQHVIARDHGSAFGVQNGNIIHHKATPTTDA